MRRVYRKLVYETYDRFYSIEEAIQQQEYIRSFYLDDDLIGRQELYMSGRGLVKVIHFGIEPPLDALLDEHFREHPSAICEVETPPIQDDQGLRVVRSWLYVPTKVLRSHGLICRDAEGRVVKRVHFGADGTPDGEDHQIYGKDGRLQKMLCYDASGRLVQENNYGDWT
jgi:hypothetical protein